MSKFSADERRSCKSVLVLLLLLVAHDATWRLVKKDSELYADDNTNTTNNNNSYDNNHNYFEAVRSIKSST